MAMNESITSSVENAPPPPEPVLTPTQAAQRACSVLITVGIVQVIGLTLPFVAPFSTTGGGDESVITGINPLVVSLAITGVVYVLVGIPVRFQVRPAIWCGLIAALAQTIIFSILSLFAIIAGIRTMDPGSLTMGILLFGTIASIHFFVMRWLWLARGGH